MGETTIQTDVGNGDAEGLRWDDGDECAITHFLVDGLADFPNLADCILRFDPGFFDQLNKGAGGAVADGWLVGIHLDDRVINAHAGECGEDVLDGVNFHRALGERGGTLYGLNLVSVGTDKGLVR